MRVLLIYPLVSKKPSFSHYHFCNMPPLGLAYLAAYLRHVGHEVMIVDRNVEMYHSGYDADLLEESMRGYLQDFSPQWVGVSVLTPQVFDARHVLKLCKEMKPETKTVLGGQHASFAYHDLLSSIYQLDSVVIGEGEATLADMVSGKLSEEVLGIAYRKINGNIRVNKPRSLIEDLDKLPYPARDLLDMNFYTAPYFSKSTWSRATTIMTSRGCPYSCNYCAGSLSSGRRFRTASPEYVIGEIDTILTLANIDYLHFADDSLGINRERDEKLFELMIATGLNKRIKWVAQLHPAVVQPSLVRLMKEAGCVLVELGFESASTRMLRIMGKNGNVELYEKAAQIIKSERLGFKANIIVGYWQETLSDLSETIQFIGRIEPSRIHVSVFQPYPGTRVYNDLLKEGYDVNWDGLDNTTLRWQGIGDGENFNFSEITRSEFEKIRETHLSRYKISNKSYAIHNYFRQAFLSVPLAFLICRWLLANAKHRSSLSSVYELLRRIGVVSLFYKLVHNYSRKKADLTYHNPYDRYKNNRNL